MLKPEFIASLADLGEYATPLSHALLTTPSVAVRANISKKLPSILSHADRMVPWCPQGIYLPERPIFTLDPAIHQGRYYVQDASSMFISHAVRSLGLSEPVLALDACAAPGGKTTALIDALPEASVVVANEIVPKRAAILRENMLKWGATHTIITRADSRALARTKVLFDLIVADVPCSGEGMMRKDEEAATQWSPKLVQDCSLLQSEILDNLLELLRPGGILIYSTCTFNLSENEHQVQRLVEEHGLETIPVNVDPEWGIVTGLTSPESCLRFLPGRVRGEGLFMALLRKPGEGRNCLTDASPNKPKGKETPSRDVPPRIASWIRNPQDFTFSRTADRVNATPLSMTKLLGKLERNVDVIHHGIPLATVKGRDAIPTQALAMSTALNPASFPTAELESDAALSYLRGDAITLPSDLPAGHILLTFEQAPLGFVKNLGNRTNNLYPRDWRIHTL